VVIYVSVNVQYLTDLVFLETVVVRMVYERNQLA